LAGEVKTPPMSVDARREMGFLLRQLQEGENLSLPNCRCQQLEAAATRLRVNDKNKTWRLFYFLDSDAIVILEVWEKKTRKTSQATIELCQRQAKEL